MKSLSLFAKFNFSLFLLALVLISCKKNEATESTETKTSSFGNIAYFAKASLEPVKSGIGVITINGDSVVKTAWSSASVYVEKISFTGRSNNLLDTTIIIEKNLNIFSANTLAGVIKLPAGSYKDVKVKLYCKKSLSSERAFTFKGTFVNKKGAVDSLLVGSSLPFEANLAVPDITIKQSDSYKVTFNFDLNRVLLGISTAMLENGARFYNGTDGKKMYVIYKGGSASEPFYDQVIANWQTVASVTVVKE
ncbi:hypothetical protein EZ428_23795 [Pedobacter frigiditerrae]|uniref:DUF4382 domain-containing protein n=1 Tax=Pedobacter frigiditerrae TaxID=2530452 RepID=A0A4R0MIR5_9SPHI|nr:hypothetical protein [Pedobacter frigiditerrae]TCC86489.1 hypothetical protein EZ428_23795 [Pedobacter frigiditerrae]